MRNDLKIAMLMEAHRKIDLLFFEHQKALLRFKFDKALALLGEYRDALLAHMRDEERLLMPIYRERVKPDKGGNPALFLDEHEKMRAYVALFADTIAELRLQASPEKTLLNLLDRESFYKRLSSHHDIREREIFYPELDNVLSRKELTDIFRELEFPAGQPGTEAKNESKR